MVAKVSAESNLPPLSFVAWLCPLVDAVVNAQFGPCDRQPSLKQSSLASSAPLIVRRRLENAVVDRFLLAIPYAEDYIYCHFSFCYQIASQFPRVMVLTRKPEERDDLEELEDVDFDPFRFRKLASNVPGSFIPAFHYDDPDALLSLLRCITSEFGQYQRRKLLQSGHLLFTDFLSELQRPQLQKIDKNTELRAYEDGNEGNRAAIVSRLTVISKEKTSMINMTFTLTIVMHKWSTSDRHSNTSVTLNSELENLLVAYEPPKMGDLSLIRYLRLVQEDIGQMLYMLSLNESNDEESKVMAEEETKATVESPYEDCYLPDDPRLHMRWSDFRAK
uniref:Uncharacterized protein n=1 Tax=Plectus sambesii TaxID=2011161 RepID=A0A914WF99_9BILA